MKRDETFLGEIEQRLNDALGFPTGTTTLKTVCEKYKGSSVYIPSATEIYIERRNEEIRTAFRGDNYAALADRWGLSVCQVRRIVRAKKIVASSLCK